MYVIWVKIYVGSQKERIPDLPRTIVQSSHSILSSVLIWRSNLADVNSTPWMLYVLHPLKFLLLFSFFFKKRRNLDFGDFHASNKNPSLRDFILLTKALFETQEVSVICHVTEEKSYIIYLMDINNIRIWLISQKYLKIIFTDTRNFFVLKVMWFFIRLIDIIPII